MFDRATIVGQPHGKLAKEPVWVGAAQREQREGGGKWSRQKTCTFNLRRQEVAACQQDSLYKAGNMSSARSEQENVENARHVRTCQVNKATHSGASVLCNNTKLGGLLTIDFRLVLADFAACYQPVGYQPQQEQQQQQEPQQQLRLLRFAGHLDCDWGRTRFALWHIHKSHLQSSAVCAEKKCNSAGSGQGEGGRGVISN